MQYLDFEYKTTYCEDEGQYWFYAAYNFVGANGEHWTGKSPTYKQRDSDLHCLHEDAMIVDSALRQGATREQVCGKFKQAC